MFYDFQTISLQLRSSLYQQKDYTLGSSQKWALDVRIRTHYLLTNELIIHLSKEMRIPITKAKDLIDISNIYMPYDIESGYK